MSDISVIGLGLMGMALAETIQKTGHSLTVWNRSAEKMTPLVDAGAIAAESFSAAVESSPVLLICIDNHATSNQYLQSAETAPLLQGKTVIQLSTGTSGEAADTAAWMEQQEALYLDGAILAGPPNIGTEDATILVAGNSGAWQNAKPLIDCLGEVRYLGENYRAPAALDLAWLCDSYGRFIAVSQAACICEADGVGIDEFAQLFSSDSYVRRYANVIHKNSFQQCTATLDVWHDSLKMVLRQGRDADVDTRFLELVDSYWSQAHQAGFGEEHGIALFKAMSKLSSK